MKTSSLIRLWLGTIFAGQSRRPLERWNGLCLLPLEDRITPATIVVTNVNDSGAGSLRQALIDANSTTVSDTVVFSIVGGPAVKVISLASSLPFLSEPTIIDGYTQAGSSVNTLSSGNNAVLTVVIDGSAISSGDALQFGGNSFGGLVRGLSIINTSGGAGIALSGGTTGVQIAGNFIGVRPDGTTGAGNNLGVLLTTGATSNTIGGATPAERNLISANSGAGVSIQDNTSSNNTVQGNFIGTTRTGAAALGNSTGVEVVGSITNTIGGTAVGAGNVISGNTAFGVHLLSSANGNSIQGNRIGTNSTGTAALANITDGVRLSLGANGNFIGGVAAGAGNLISGNGGNGLSILDNASNGNVVQGNFIGTDITGSTALANGSDGVVLFNRASSTTIGGTTAGARNVISGNGLAGVEIFDNGTINNVVSGNYIGTDATGTTAIGNAAGGVIVRNQASNTTIGGTTAGAGNLISGNQTHGVVVSGAGTTSNSVQGNFIGTNAAGTSALGNTIIGVLIQQGATNTTVGGTTAGARNVISGNAAQGVMLRDGGTNSNFVIGNRIGTNSAGTAAVGNGGDGVLVFLTASSNFIGGTAAGAGNQVSGNLGGGVKVEGVGTTGNAVQGNFIGTNAAGTAALGNVGNGVVVFSGATSNLIGGTTAGARNVISGNAASGVVVQDSNTSGNVFQGNYIGTNAAGTAAVGNTFDGVLISAGANNNTIGGTTAGARNVISGNGVTGIRLVSSGTSANAIYGNYIGIDASGNNGLGNAIGISVGGGADANLLGGNGGGQGNVISGNASAGVAFFSAVGANTLRGNIIGLNAGVTAARNNNSGVQFSQTGETVNYSSVSNNIVAGNTNAYFVGGSGNTLLGFRAGVNDAGTAALYSDSRRNFFGFLVVGANTTIGGTGGGQGAVVGGNASTGIEFQNPSNGSRLLGSFVGTDVTGSTAIANGAAGVHIIFASGVVIGGAAGNVISGNAGDGVLIDVGSTGNTLSNNLIGLNAAGTAALGNGVNGVSVRAGASNNDIGVMGAGNVISGNSSSGVMIRDGGTSNNRVLGNFIGLNAAGTAAVANGAGGVLIQNAATGTIVGNASVGNVISGNTGNGVTILDAGTTGTSVAGNFIGLNAAGDTAVANTANGVFITSGASGNTIGTATGTINVISGNAGAGIVIAGAGTSSNTVIGNRIGTNVGGTSAVANGSEGVILTNGATGNTVGGTTAGARNTVSGNSGSGIQISGIGTSNNTVLGNFIGLDLGGTSAVANNAFGIVVQTGASSNTIGGTTASARNTISGNGASGIVFWDAGTTGNVVQGNFIGLNSAGTAAVANGANGVAVLSGSSANTIGGATAGAGNVISGNLGNGVLVGDAGTTGNTVAGNFIGTNAAGTAAVANGISGVLLNSGAVSNTVGGTTAGARNVLSGNAGDGVSLQDAGTSGNTILGNYIGTDLTGNAALGNSQNGVAIQGGASGNTLGGTTAGARNVISGNAGDGVTFLDSGTTGNAILGNYIGTNAAGNTALSNTFQGVFLRIGADGNTIGGATAGAGNVISGNDDGIRINSDNNTVQGNRIGTDAAGTAAIANRLQGVSIASGNNNTVGGPAVGAGNLISGNNQSGVLLLSATGNTVFGNHIGTDASGNAALANGANGVTIASASTNNTIGGVGVGNIISGNNFNGVAIDGSGNSNNTLLGNFIGTNAAGTGAVANGVNGVAIANGATGNTVGGTAAGEGNLISGNNANGVLLSAAGTGGNTILGNRIGTSAAGTFAVGNAGAGVVVQQSASNNVIGGTAAGARNVVSGNATDGIVVNDVGTDGTQILGNFIGLSILGSMALGNAGRGIVVTNGATNTVVGGTTAAERNVISGNLGSGIEVNGSVSNITSNTSITGNYIGTNAAGTAAIGNSFGIIVFSGTDTKVGGTAAGAGNLISGNANNGLEARGAGTSLTVQGNLIGTNAAGTTALGNLRGVALLGGITGQVVGGTTPAARNIISGNSSAGVFLGDAGTSGNAVSGNYIGTNAAGTAAVANGIGVSFAGTGATNNTIGGTTPGDRNVISGNVSSGVSISGTSDTSNTVAGNYIGTNAAGASAVANGTGILLDTTTNNLIGGATAGFRNVISGNSGAGVLVLNSTGIDIFNNYVGTNAAGTAAVANSTGIAVNLGSDTVRVGTTNGGNVISGNTFSGILFQTAVASNTIDSNIVGLSFDSSARVGNAIGVLFSQTNDTVTYSSTFTNNTVAGNTNAFQVSGTGNTLLGFRAGVDDAGTAALFTDIRRNLRGIAVVGANTTIGGTAAGEGAVVGGNSGDGIFVIGATGTTVLGSFIGTDASGTSAIGNGGNGVYVDTSSNATIGGTAVGAGNVISGNSGNGIHLLASTLSSVLGNTIGTNAAGTAALANNSAGILIDNGSSNNTIGGSAAGSRNLISGNSGSGVQIRGLGTSNNAVSGNFLGTNAAGTAAIANSYGVSVSSGASLNLVGGFLAGAGNLISGNALSGVQIFGNSTISNTVAGNLIGTDGSGTVALGNSQNGVIVSNGANGNAIGSASPGGRNVISGNSFNGVSIQDAGTSNNSVTANFIGTNSSGTAALGNAGNGVFVFNAATGNTIGGTTAASRNVISGNIEDGILIRDPGTNGNLVAGNYIGTNAAGTASVANRFDGVVIDFAASGNIIGSTTLGNVISGNNQNGVSIGGASTGNTVQNNFIGTDASGTGAVANSRNGVGIDGAASSNIIGGSAAGARNVISGNFLAGVSLLNAGTTANTILGNYVGTDATGTTAVGNGTGVFLDSGASFNTIGGTTAGSGNVISGNGGSGVELQNSVNGNAILGNYIGTDAAGTTAIANADNGILLNGNASFNTIGGTVAGARNVISGNSQSGIAIGNASNDNTILGNYIGTNAAGTAAIGNSSGGVFIQGGSSFNTIGGTVAGAGNVISGNSSSGVFITDAGTSDNTIAGNFIGLNAAGTAAIGNNGNGVEITNFSRDNTVGGTVAGARNVISGNNQNGVSIGGASTGNTVLGNYIGTEATGTNAVSNRVGVNILGAASGNVVGAAGAANLISGNALAGVQVLSDNNAVRNNTIGLDVTQTAAISNGTPSGGAGVSIGFDVTDGTTTSTSGNVVQNNTVSGNDNNAVFVASASETDISGNTIGTDGTGTTAVANGGNGIVLLSSNTVSISNNLISGNGTIFPDSFGIQVTADSTGISILGNTIGTNRIGTAAIANVRGIGVRGGASNVTIGGSGVGEGNLISGNTFDGILFDGTTGNTVVGNRIGTNAIGNAAVANSIGISVVNVSATNLISANLISGNATGGVSIGSGSTGNTLTANRIGTDVLGTTAVANGGSGVVVAAGADGNAIGESRFIAPGVTGGNLISGNGGHGILLSSNNNSVMGNLVGTAGTGNTAIGNGADGIAVFGSNNSIGSEVSASGNVVSGNAGAGIAIVEASGNRVRGNYVGTNSAGSAAVANAVGILVTSGASGNTIGGTTFDEANLVSGNTQDGIRVSGSANTVISGNRIGTNLDGSAAIANGMRGIAVLSGSTNTLIGGTVVGSGNLISGNAIGIQIDGAATTDTNVQANFIGTTADGSSALGNGTGILISGGSSRNQIGAFSGSGLGNLIAFNLVSGVVVTGASFDNAIVGNTIFRNAALGIDLGGDGQNTQKTTFSNTDPNGGANAPLVVSVSTNSIKGTLTGRANTTYRLEFFADDTLDAFGQGRSFLGFMEVTTDASGNATFDMAYNPVGGQPTISVTATRFRDDRSAADTSEFSTSFGNRVSITGTATLAEGDSTQLRFDRTGDLTQALTVRVQTAFVAPATLADFKLTGGTFSVADGILTVIFGAEVSTLFVIFDAVRDQLFEQAEEFGFSLIESGFVADSKSATVTVSASPIPVIQIRGTQGEQDDGRPFDFGWTVPDMQTNLRVKTVVLRNSEPIFESADATGDVNLKGSGLGTYEIVVQVLDLDGKVLATARRQAAITDDDVTGPEIDLSSSVDANARFYTFRYAVRDGSGLAGVEALLLLEGQVVTSSRIPRGQFVIDALTNSGNYELVVRATDDDNDRPDDRTSAESRMIRNVALLGRISSTQSSGSSGGAFVDTSLSGISESTPQPAILAREASTPIAVLTQTAFREVVMQIPRDDKPQDQQRASQTALVSQAPPTASVASPRDRAFGLLPLPGNTGVQGVSPLLDGDDSVGLIEHLRQLNQSPGDAASTPVKTSLAPAAVPEKPAPLLAPPTLAAPKLVPAVDTTALLPEFEEETLVEPQDRDEKPVSPDRLGWLGLMLPLGLASALLYRHIRASRTILDEESDGQLSGIRLR